MKSITIIGSSVIDVLASPVSQTVFKTGSFPVEKTNLSFGGNGLNETSALAKLGANVNLVSIVGKDEAGKRIVDYLNGIGVNTKFVLVKENVPTSINIVLVDENGERFFLTNPKSTLRNQEIKDILPYVKDMGDIVCFSSLFVSPKLSMNDMEVLFKEIKSFGKTICLDMTKRKNDETLNDIKPMLKYVDYVFPNKEEAKLLTNNEDVIYNAKMFIEAGCKCIVIKLGKDGCILKTKDIEEKIDAIKNVKVVDTTGAGDSFVAGFIYGLSKEWDITKCAKMGCATASCSIEKLGATDGIQSLEQVIKRL